MPAILDCQRERLLVFIPTVHARHYLPMPCRLPELQICLSELIKGSELCLLCRGNIKHTVRMEVISSRAVSRTTLLPVFGCHALGGGLTS